MSGHAILKGVAMFTPQPDHQELSAVLCCRKHDAQMMLCGCCTSFVHHIAGQGRTPACGNSVCRGKLIGQKAKLSRVAADNRSRQCSLAHAMAEEPQHGLHGKGASTALSISPVQHVSIGLTYSVYCFAKSFTYHDTPQ